MFRTVFTRIVAFCALLLLAATLPAAAKHTFRVKVDGTDIDRTVDTFVVEKVGTGGIVILKLQPPQPDLAGSLLQLGKKTKYSEEPVSGEASWLAYVASSNRVVARMPSNVTSKEVPDDTIVLSTRPNPKPIDPVDGALDAAEALAKLDLQSDALELLRSLAEDPTYKANRCRLLTMVMKIQAPGEPKAGEPFPAEAERTLQSIMTECSTGPETDAAGQYYMAWTLARIKSLPKDAGIDAKTILNDAKKILAKGQWGDMVLLTLAQISYDEGDAEEGSKILKQFFVEYPASPLKDKARALQENLERRAPVKSHKKAGIVGGVNVSKSLGLKKVAAIAFDPKGNFILVDQGSPAKVRVLSIDLAKLEYKVEREFSLPNKDWEPVAVASDSKGNLFFLDNDETQVVGVDPKGEALSVVFPNKGDDWKLRALDGIAVVRDSELLVLDSSSEGVHRYSIEKGDQVGFAALEGTEVEAAKHLAVAPDGIVTVAINSHVSVFDAKTGTKGATLATRNKNEFAIGRVGMDRWRYVYLFDSKAKNIEKMRRNGQWLNTVINYEKEGIPSSSLWAISPEGDVLLYDSSNDQLIAFTQ